MKISKYKLNIVLLSLFSIGLIIFLLFLKINFQKKSDLNDVHAANPNNLNFYETAYKFTKNKPIDSNKNVVGGIIPHHLLAADLISEFYSNLEGRDYEIIVLIGPNHFLTGKANIITSAYDWETPYGVLRHDSKILTKLLEFGKIKVEEKIFKDEHSINSEVAFIKKTFPEAKFLPVVLSPRVTKDDAEKFSNYLFQTLNDKKALVLASVDFSHYKDNITAQANDKISIDAINNFSYDSIYNLDIDSPASVYTLLKFCELNNANFNLLNNSNSAILTNKLDIKNTTSYVTGYFSINDNLNKFYLPETKNSDINLLFFGDLMIDRYVNNLISKNGLNSLFFDFDKENFLEGYDLVGANLEGAVTNNGAHYDPIMAYDFAFSPLLIKTLAEEQNFNFFNLANNHFSDQGERGIIETRENLDNLGVDYSGCRDKKIDDCSYRIVEINNKKIGMVGFSTVYGLIDMDRTENLIKELRDKTDIIITNIHWGVEYEHAYNNLQQEIAHKLIDSGVDIIIGHHPHVVQGIEVYKGKPIFYSLGNFIFDQYFSKDTQEGLGVGINIFNKKLEISLFPFISKISQPGLMNDIEKEEFLNNITSWSRELEDTYKKELAQGKFIIDL